MGKDHDLNCDTYKFKDSKMIPFEDALKDILDYDPKSKVPSKTVVLPPASRTHRDVDYKLDGVWFELVEKDLDLRSLGGGWGEKGNGNAVITQLFIGSGQENDGMFGHMGTGWHRDICNSAKIHLSGSKKWTLIHGKYSSLMRPTMKAGKTAIQGTDLTMREEVEPYLPRIELFLNPGDYMYIPDFYWHKV